MVEASNQTSEPLPEASITRFSLIREARDFYVTNAANRTGMKWFHVVSSGIHDFVFAHASVRSVFAPRGVTSRPTVDDLLYYLNRGRGPLLA
jgi:hypothetical protein